MRYFYVFTFALIVTFTFCSQIRAQDSPEKPPESIFVDLTNHNGWGPFVPREGFNPQYRTGTFNLAGQDYKVYVLIDPNMPRREQRFLFQKSGNEHSFSEGKGLPVYYRFEYIQLENASYEIYGYSKKADQFVLFLKDDVPYVYEGLPAGSKAPDFEGISTKDHHIQLSDYRDSYVLLDFWGTWCGPCLQETPYLKEAYKKFSDEVVFIGIAVDNNKQRLIEYVKENNVEWPQIVVPHNSNDPPPIVSAYNVFGYPSMYLIDPKGKVLIGPEKEIRLRGKRLSETLGRIITNK